MMRRKGVGRTTGVKSWMVVSSDTGAEPRIEDVGKHSIMRRTGLPARDLRVLDPILSHPSSILVRERAIVVNLEHVKAIITATEILMIHSSDPFFDSFLQDLLTRFIHQTPSPIINDMNDGYQAKPPAMGHAEDSQNDSHVKISEEVKADSPKISAEMAPIGPKQLPFEFRVLETCIESACRCLESEASRLEEEAYPALDKLTSQLCTPNLERARHIKSRLVALSGRVQKVADELEYLLDDDNDLAEMHLTEKFNAGLLDMPSLKEDTNQSDESNSNKYDKFPNLKLDVKELEMLLEAYFAQTNGILQRLFSLAEYVGDTEDYINIMLDDKQNQLLQGTIIFNTLNMILNAGIVVVGLFGMNITIELFEGKSRGNFEATIGGTIGGCSSTGFLEGKENQGPNSCNADIESVWNALADYDHLADLIPNLVWSGKIPCPYPGRIWLEQRGFQRSMYWHIEARVVLDLQEFINSAWDRELHFSMVDGDFKKFEGKWSVKSGTRSSSTNLYYEVNVIPRFNFPAIFLERIIRSNLPVNLHALAYRVERNISGYQKLSLPENHLDKTSSDINESSAQKINNALCENKEDLVNSIPGILPMPSSEVNINNWGAFGKTCRLDRPCVMDEIHLRRFDGLLENGGVHRSFFASITVKAPVRDVWSVMSSYESLPEIVPNLAISKIVSRDNNKVCILQEGCKDLLYMVLHARVVLDLCEYLEQEISFEQIEGDFDSFQGKWTFEQVGNHHTLLKYSVESKMRKDTFLSEAIMEEVIYEDLPSNLCAIRDYNENNTASNILDACKQNTNLGQQTVPSGFEDDDSYCSAKDLSDCNAQSSSQQRPRVPGLQRDIEVLKSELLKFIAEHGQGGFMPMREQLRLHGRVDIEKAINRMGGFRKIATIMNLSRAYKHHKPKGYWDNLEILHYEISRFQRSWGMDPSFMPSRRSFEHAGRFDIARALEKWGELRQVSRLLSLKVRRQRSRQGNFAKDKKVDDDVASPNVDSEIKTPSRPTVSQDPQKWLTELKQLDTNWVE